jgi:antirestriction protein ArdC
MRITNDDTGGIWDPSCKAIIIKRNKLSSIQEFAATLLHETGHALSGASDCTRLFENTLTNYLGLISDKAIL